MRRLNFILHPASLFLTYDFCLATGAVHYCGTLYATYSTVDNQVDDIAELLINQFGVGAVFNVFVFVMGSVAVMIGASSRRASSCIIGWSGIRIPTSFRLRNIFGRRTVPFKIKVKAPGRLRFINLNVLLSNLAYSLILLRS